MKRKSIALLCIVLCRIILQINVISSNAQEKVNLFDEILVQTKGKTVEYGLKASFKTGEDPKTVCNYLIKNLQFDNSEIKSNNYENEDSYCIEFSSGSLKGYIEALKHNNENVITISISKIDNQNGLESLKNKISHAIPSRGEDIKYFQYLKAKILESSISEFNEDTYAVNKRIIKILKSHGTCNIETVNINNGLSTIAYTKQYGSMVNNNKLIDFNYAVCNYSSGRYIIIGTPEIITTY
ncbi:YwmB family TATA-box binding protein [Clostridium tagluense]|uniref:YwmB family TATA-box binding protein n=1 Tax=Clostridium tagluense TaxID=360422 RepID=UPI001C0D0ECE|nr:YwmB family TATA-box binding protein [Clostridium tagluense]MBU3127355.1 YwmB family TATA-box binding protein [Clostridium tagluense]MCB2311171.1 YwmB family TATA-box binding protein [Clostridium tagluense]MCB2315895.1 YwmB family TATA-box binding protein [Clostridium tagluense]MCB2320758.1 YwmB family TATA-box binding protein [Clostridium tagluense]MCB2325775.1 YwmB family TATA-box binding protein [Clostridium tagluense]